MIEEPTDAEILEFLLSKFQMHSPQMNGEHSWRFMSTGFPMNRAKGRSARDAVIVCMRAEEESVKEYKEKYPDFEDLEYENHYKTYEKMG